jgi:hypothetical protein
MNVLRLLLLFFLISITELATAQSYYAVRRERNLILTAGLGSANYYGDLVNPGEWGTVRYNLMFGGEFFLNQRVSVRAELAYFRLAGDDSKADDDRVERNLSFFSGNMELSATGTVSLLKMGKRFYQRPRLNLYGFGGVGMLYMNPRAERQNGDNVTLRPLLTENREYARVQPVIPFGLGIKYVPHPYYNIIVEGGYRLSFTDYIDDVSSTRYVDPALLSSDLSREMADRRRERDPNYPVRPGLGKRGNPDNNDGYLLLQVKVQYYWPYEVGYQARHRKAFNRINRGGQGKGRARKPTNY